MKVLKWLLPFMVLIALCLYLFNIDKEYDFLLQLSLVSKLNWGNPIDDFKTILSNFEKFGNINWTVNFWSATASFFKLIGNILKAPVDAIVTIVKDLALGLKAVLIMLGMGV